MTTRQKYNREFKLEAIRLLDEGNKTGTAIARELGVKRTLLYRWRDPLTAQGEDAFPGKGGKSSEESRAMENARLKRELAKTQEENETLKKAAAFFARELK